ncbi:hypothetical protein TIFTF001_045007 [Ficus carica]|uniref:BSD domain-containing protein n=1 Tax=Ficus carica TaxID=3494 RepID=A0AA88DEH7_FICCA|nr:hypothetical protein TIFTF001_045006 [Ficus carica]GMN35359.1 hypothetical protein TIFTF001_045007 [Ficus carica]
MSWLFKSVQSDDPQASTSESPATSTAGVKEDLSVIGQTIGRQLRGVAAFLAPPPPPTAADGDSPELEAEAEAEEEGESASESEALIGIRNDLAEIGGSFKSGLTLLSSNSSSAVSGISRFASNFLQFQDESRIEEEEDGIPGITDDVLQLVAQISKRPECWTDFPLRLDHEFSMSDAQREHASTVEQLIPDFAALRLKLCNSMREDVFWMIYFILLVPRLSGNDSELLSTPDIVEARDVLLQKLQNTRDSQIDTSENSKLPSMSQDHIQVSQTQGRDNQSSEHDQSKSEVSDKASTEQFLDKGIDESANSSAADVKFETEDDISFSDLEDDDSELSRRLSDSRRMPDVRTSPRSESSDWVQLSGSPEAQSGKQKARQSQEKDSEGEESSGWLTVDDYD